MKLMELEQQLGILFPKKFHEIYETGAMEWLEMNSEQIQKNRNDYLQDTKAFLMLNCDCEPYSFDEIPEAMDTLKEWIQCREEDEEQSLLEGITLIPFGHGGNGDLYCFLYAPHFSEPQVILYAHDDDEAPEIIGHTFEEFLFLQLLDAIANEEEKNGVHFQENCKFLSPAEQVFFMEKQEDALIAYYDQLEPEYAQIWED